jgi:ribosome-binding protein aMBF1 (putative translation factor)
MNKVERDIPIEIEAACERIQHLIATEYLPDALRRDLELLMQAATRADAEEGTMIRKARDANWSQQDLARRVGGKQENVHRVEAEEIKNSSHLASIASALGIPIEKVVIRKLSR